MYSNTCFTAEGTVVSYWGLIHGVRPSMRRLSVAQRVRFVADVGRCPAVGSSQSFMKILRLLLCSAALLCRSGALAARKVTSAIVTGRDGQDPHLDIVSGAAPAPGANAWASYAATYSSIGWDVLNVTTSATGPAGESDDMYAAGYLEGYLTQKAIYTSYQNSALTQQPWPCSMTQPDLT